MGTTSRSTGDESVAHYDAIAAWYDSAVRGGGLLHDLITPALDALLGEVAGARLLDLACGQGVVARRLAVRGAVVTGVDLSGQLLDIACAEECAAPLGITYHQGDARQLGGVPDASFDGVICNMALQDIVDLAATFRAVARVLRPAGYFVFTITHPCLETIRGQPRLMGSEQHPEWSYFAEGAWRSNNPDGVRGRVPAYHRTISTWLNTLADAGFRTVRLAEPEVMGDLIARYPRLQGIPAVLAVRALRDR